MKPATLLVKEDERAWSLRERNLVRPPTHQWHRYQIITVVRDDHLAEWWHDLGPAEQFKGPEIEVPSLGEHSVAELREIADGYRNRTDWISFAAEQRAESTLIADFLTQTEENWKIINNQSVFGPGGQIQRNGFPKKEVLEHANSNG